LMSKLFGFKIQDTGVDKSKKLVSPVPPNEEDKSDYYIQSGFYGQYVDIEGVYKNEQDLVKRYREMALHPECDSAIEDVVNEAIVSDLNDSPVEIELSNLPASDKLKQIIRDEFKSIKEIMDFDRKAHEIFRNWYVDGKIFYHKVIDLKNPSAGIQEIRYIDPIKIRFIRKAEQTGQNANFPASLSRSNEPIDIHQAPKIEEYYLYDPNSSIGSSGSISFRNDAKSVKIAKDAITYVTSGLVDRNKQTILSYLHKSIKALNQLRMIEDSLVIYRLSRAPERRIFYIDVGNLPKIKAEQYLRDVMNRYRNKLVYNADTGEIKDDRKYMAMLEDFWLPRREGGRGTEITTLPGGQNLGELADIEYFQKKLYKSLNVPSSRIDVGGGGFNLGRSSEILRDELKFTRFVGRLRKRFSEVFNDMLKTQLILKNIVTLQDWEVLREHIQYDYVYDNHFSDLKENELRNDQLGVVAAMEPYIGKYFSAQYIRSKVLKQSDGQMKEIDAQIEKEIKEGIIPDPNQPIDPTTGMPMQSSPNEMNLGQPIMEPDLEKQGKAAEIEMPKGGEI
ncbi:MAG: portal protein, partial [Nitrosarchaeum sp.]|nr:portal protein [Nitrosarchaeum sp.]